MNRRRAVITGLGPVTAAGIGVAALWKSVVGGRSGIVRCTRFPTEESGPRCAAEVQDFVAEEYISAGRLKRLDRYAQFAVASARLAIDDAGLAFPEEALHPACGVSYGTALGGVASAEAEHRSFLARGRRGVDPSLALQVFGGSAHANIAMEFGLQGPCTTNSNSCASGTVAVGDALGMIRGHAADVVIAGGAEAPLSPLTFGAFALIRAMSRREPPEACCPFDARRDGFVMGEGACGLVVEELDRARARGARIYAEVLGYALTNDAYHMTAPRPDGSVAARTMRLALEDAGVEPRQIDYINAHASSTKANDSTEAAAIREVFGAHADRLPVSGTKAFTGHPLGASGAIEAALCALALREEFVPPTLHHREADPACDLDVVPRAGRPAALRYVLSNSFGFGGINACLVLGRAGD